MKKILKASKAFTLIELLIVIAIIGVLASLIMPNITSVITRGDQVKAKNNGRSIAQAWMNYTRAGTRNIVAGNDIYEWAAVLAEKADLNEPSIWILDFDLPVMDKRAMGAPMPVSVANKTGNNWQINPEFKAYPLSWEVANRADPNGPTGTPLVWSRGLKPSGDWDLETGVFKDSGGVIAFNDAHVEFYPSLRDENTRQGILKTYGETQRTYNIAQAIRGGSANILKSEVDVYEE